MMRGRRYAIFFGVFACAACGSFLSDDPAPQTGVDDSGTTDVVTDGGNTNDSGITDSSSTPLDGEAAACPVAGQTLCTSGDDAGGASQCVDLMSDAKHCGSCDRECGDSVSGCLFGECEHLIFVTSTVISGALGGLDGADMLCQNLAEQSGTSKGHRPFKAWLSSPAMQVADRMVHGNRRYVDRQNMTIANSWTSLVAGNLVRGVGWSEQGTNMFSTQTSVRTATTSAGKYVGPSDCNGWTQATTENTFGLVATVGTWTQSGTQSCGESAHLYCVEQ